MRDWKHCAVPYCPRKTRREIFGDEWLCSDHWRLVPKQMKRIHRRATQAYLTNPSLEGVKREVRIWQRLKREAIEVALGIRAS